MTARIFPVSERISARGNVAEAKEHESGQGLEAGVSGQFDAVLGSELADGGAEQDRVIEQQAQPLVKRDLETLICAR